MALIGSLAALAAGKTTGFVGYPRNYINKGTPETSFIQGVDQAGEPFTLKITLPAHQYERAKVKTDTVLPTVEAMSETHRRARNPCIAMPDNGPLNITGGVFVAEQVSTVDAEKGFYTANWLSILKDWESAPTPRFGLGYLETNVKLDFTAEIEMLKQSLASMNQKLVDAREDKGQQATVEHIDGMDLIDFMAQRDALAMKLYRSAKKWFIGVDVQYQRLEALDVSNEALVRRHVIELIESNTHNGMYGGVILRPWKESEGRQVVDMGSVRRINHQFDYRNPSQGVPPADKAWNDFVKYGAGWMKAMKRDGFNVDIIPVQRINAGKISNQIYSNDYNHDQLPKHLKAFVDKPFHMAPYANFGTQNAFLVSPVAIRTADSPKAEFAGTVLLSTIHAFGKVVGNAAELDRNGERTFKMSAPPQPVAPRARRPQPEPSLD
jgi:hypothetical protein